MTKLNPYSTVTLSNGVEMPLFGYSLENIGTKVYNLKSQAELLLAAINTGYRYFDTAEEVVFEHWQKPFKRAAFHGVNFSYLLR